MFSMDSRVGAYVVLIEHGHLLLVRGIWTPVPQWMLPGGGIELGETAEDCAAREVFEETGYEVAIARILGVFDQYISREQRVSVGDRPLHLHQVIYEGDITGGSLNPASDTGNDRAEWVALSKVHGLVRVRAVDRALSLAGYHQFAG